MGIERIISGRLTSLFRSRDDSPAISPVVPEWPICGEVPHSCVDFVDVPRNNDHVRRLLEKGILEVVAKRDNPGDPDRSSVIVRRRLKTEQIAIGTGVTLGGLALVYALYRGIEYWWKRRSELDKGS